MIFLNLKSYKESTGANAHKIMAQVAQYVHDNPAAKDKFCIVPSALQLESFLQKYPGINYAAQHTDAVELGATTGWTPAEAIKDIGVEYTLLNHSERRVFDETIISKIEFIQSKGIKVVVCCENVEEAKYLLQAKPFAIAYEAKELIGSGKSIATEKPEVVKEFTTLVKGQTKAIIGAGISTGNDIAKGIELGAQGFIPASAFVKAENHYAKLAEFVNAFNL